MDNLFGIYLEQAADCIVRHNEVSAHGLTQNTSGNGIHLWHSPNALIEDNHVDGHRDGIYFEFSEHGVTRRNISEHSERYGLHFMFSDSCRYEKNIFRDNNSGVAVMYSRGIVMRGNRFERSWGGAAYGLLLKEILGGRIEGNRFEKNSTGVYLEGSAHLAIRDNEFVAQRLGGEAARRRGGRSLHRQRLLRERVRCQHQLVSDDLDLLRATGGMRIAATTSTTTASATCPSIRCGSSRSSSSSIRRRSCCCAARWSGCSTPPSACSPC